MEVIDWIKLILAGIVVSIGVALLIGWFLLRQAEIALQALDGITGIEREDGHNECEEIAEVLGEVVGDGHEVDGHHPLDLAHVLHSTRMQVAPQAARDRSEQDVVHARVVALTHRLDVIEGDAG